MGKRVELNPEVLENVAGGAIGFNPDGKGTYTMKCQYTGKEFYGVSLNQIIEIGKYAATQPNNLEGEKKIIQFASDEGYI